MVLWHLTDSALPTGGFAHSAGLETYVADGRVTTAQQFQDWLGGYLRQASFNEALAVKLAHRCHARGDREGLLALDRLAHACQSPKQVRASMNSMGKRWAKVAAIVAPDAPLVAYYAAQVAARRAKGNPGIAAGLVMGASEVECSRAVAGYLMQMANSMTQNAIRAIPLGQDAGQRALVASYGVIVEATELTMNHTEQDLGVVSPQLEIAQMAHEQLYSRMFMS
ncbi:urease accessory protein UreF [Corynebacterium phocae]|uniref:Urease accessory protein UreF n=1 Tax=Corynebacterium phocae TaxID=161895 RepID=A0A1L7D6C0_9CORY|nr:urease accessory UreF family protein [Corynebacterium phocae]APT93617.1 urease accessory protein UreF [Corynebacterium phocae]KAA8726984.1 urease accessory protein UreF [Corynebacterium phocae]